jgi:hypothetical protein
MPRHADATYDAAKASPFELAIKATSRAAALRQAAVEAYIAAYLEETGYDLRELVLRIECAGGQWRYWLERKQSDPEGWP